MFLFVILPVVSVGLCIASLPRYGHLYSLGYLFHVTITIPFSVIGCRLVSVYFGYVLIVIPD